MSHYRAKKHPRAQWGMFCTSFSNELWPTFSHVAYLERDWSSPLIVKCILLFHSWLWAELWGQKWPWLASCSLVSLPLLSVTATGTCLHETNTFLLRQTQASSGACPAWFSEGRVFLSKVAEWEKALPIYPSRVEAWRELTGAYRTCLPC